MLNLEHLYESLLQLTIYEAWLLFQIGPRDYRYAAHPIQRSKIYIQSERSTSSEG